MISFASGNETKLSFNIFGDFFVFSSCWINLAVSFASVLNSSKKGIIVSDKHIYEGMIIEDMIDGRIIKAPYGKGKLKYTDNSGRIWIGVWDTFKKYKVKKYKFGKEFKK